MENNNFTYDELIGTALSYNIDTRELEIFVPKLTPTLYSNKIQTYQTLTQESSLKIKNKIDINTRVNHSNVILCKARYALTKIPTIGSKVSVTFFENDLNKPLWYIFNPNIDMCDVIDEEKYDKLINIKINDTDYQISSSDTLEIKVPDSFNINMSNSIDNNKHKILTISEKTSDIDFSSILDNIKYINNAMNSALNISKTILIESLCNVTTDNINVNNIKYYECENFSKIATAIANYNENNSNKISNITDFDNLSKIKDSIYNTNKLFTTIYSDIDNVLDKYIENYGDVDDVIESSETETVIAINSYFNNIANSINNITNSTVNAINNYKTIMSTQRTVTIVDANFNENNANTTRQVDIFDKLNIEYTTLPVSYDSELSGDTLVSANILSGTYYLDSEFLDQYSTNIKYDNDTYKITGNDTINNDIVLYPGVINVKIDYVNTTVNNVVEYLVTVKCPNDIKIAKYKYNNIETSINSSSEFNFTRSFNGSDDITDIPIRLSLETTDNIPYTIDISISN